MDFFLDSNQELPVTRFHVVRFCWILSTKYWTAYFYYNFLWLTHHRTDTFGLIVANGHAFTVAYFQFIQFLFGLQKTTSGQNVVAVNKAS